MSLQVLASRQQIIEGRRALRRRRLSCATPAWKGWLLRHRIGGGIKVGDELKSWDVLQTAEFIGRAVPRDAPVIDIGAYASEMPPVLHRMGYRRISALDLNPDIARMPHAEAIDYRVGDFLRAPYAAASFKAITAISVIEHGFDAGALVAELYRLLQPGGYFVASFDYWPEKIPTSDIRMFGMSWTIFSREDVQQFLAQAARSGLVPCGSMTFDAAERPVSCEGRHYTFAWLALQRA